MTRKRTLGLTALAGACLTASAVLGTAGAGAAGTAKPRPAAKVGIFDNYYGPAKLTIHRDQKVKWTWPEYLGDSHDVKTKTVPKGAKKFWSEPYAAGATYTQKFTVPGTYSLYCTFHSTEMTMTIVVKNSK